ncbi:ABC transporter substrate-binding protein [Curtobacterium sp. MCBD17_035]|uniref:ABC transporter substrate-binding protein n=1 Tax=Curtobacterium sp. MCBD17_035 TaxID=2175673 RepID=UPI000DA92337|nr:ABC transporter substrate-binding protein [Curtobacterium sp. MCBD17_035]WIB67323.1 ABC transporter substrate-binding protein [Curtobacterium sp. MCBD17_035]
MKQRTRVAVAAVAAAAAVVVAVGTGGATASAATTKGGTLTIARSADIISMDNTTTFDNNSIHVQQQIMEPLFNVSANGKKLTPWLAKSYSISSDKLDYTIHLRKGVEFSNGDPVTAKDVKFSLDADTATGSSGWGYINAAIDNVTAVDDATIDIHLKHAWAPLIADLSLFSNAIVPDNYGGETKEQFYTHPVGTGPYKWSSWKKGQSLTLVKNTHYWQKGKPHLKKVVFTVVPDANTRKLQLQGGQIDVDDTPDWSSLSSLASASGVAAKTFKSTQIDYIAFNQKRKPFDDVHVRRAIAYAIDRKAMVKAILFGHGSVANSLLSPGTPYYDKNADGPTYNVKKAKAELKQSSQPSGFTTTLLIRSGDPNETSIAQIMQSELKKIGITMKIKQLDPTANKQARLAGDFDMAWSAWTMDIPDPDEWTSFAVDPNGGSNSAFTNYDNAAVVKLNSQAQQSVVSSKRKALYAQLQQQTGDDAFLAYLYYSPYVYGISDKVSGFHVTPLGNFQLENVKKQS